MDGILGFLFPRKSKLYRRYSEAAKHGEKAAYAFLDTLSEKEIQKLLQEVSDLALDKLEQMSMQDMRKQLEDISYPITFSDN